MYGGRRVGHGGPVQLGADADALDRVATTLAGAATALRRTRTSLDAAVRAASWTGPDATRFAAHWQVSSAGCARTASALDTAATAARAQAADQRRASRADGVERAFGPAAAPTRIRLATLAADLSLGGLLAVGGSERLRLEDLPGGRVRVTELTAGAAGAQAGRGVTADLQIDGRVWAAGSAAQVGLMGEVGTGATWTVRSDQVDRLLMERAAALVLGVDSTPTPDTEALSLGAGVGGLATAALAAGHGAPGAAPGAPAPSVGRGSAEAVAGASASVGRDRRAGTVQVAVDASMAASLTAAFGHGNVAVVDRAIDVRSSATLTLAGDGTPLRLDLGSSWVEDGRTGGELVRRRAAVDLTAPEARSPGAALAAAMAHDLAGDRSGADRSLRRAVAALARLGPEQSPVVEDRYRISDPVSAALSTPLGSVSVQIDDLHLLPQRTN